jgi:pimeloyl-ACP methyl ester carboxylesterase
LRQGRYTGNIRQPLKIVHVAHSYGSVLSQALITKYPTISDGVVLTGMIANETDFPAFFEASRLVIANELSPGKYTGLDSGYLTYADAFANAAAFSTLGALIRRSYGILRVLLNPVE